MTFTEDPRYQRTDTVVDTPVVAAHQVPVDGRVLAPATPMPAEQVRTAYTSRWAPDAIIAALTGLVLLVVGLIAVTRGGFDGELSEPVVNVVGFAHTTTLGLIEIGIGLFLLISGATRSRGGEMFFGSVLGIAGFVGAVQTSSFEKSLALESSMASLAVIAGVVVVLSALLMPRFAKHSTTISQI
jgi:hypothetical protein